jgi:hypothetical protein
MACTTDSSNSRRYKDPDDTQDFSIDWEPFITPSTILSAAWTIQAGITKVTSGVDPTNFIATVRLSGGADHQQYLATCKITTSDGEILSQSLQIVVQEK